MRTPISTAALIGSLALTGTLLLAGCSGSSSADATAAASSAPAADAAVASEPAATDAGSEAGTEGLPPVTDSTFSYQVWASPSGADLDLYVTNTTSSPAPFSEGWVFSSVKVALADGSSLTAGALSCFTDPVPASDYTTCSVSGLSAEPTSPATEVSFTSPADASTVVVPVTSSDIMPPAYK